MRMTEAAGQRVGPDVDVAGELVAEDAAEAPGETGAGTMTTTAESAGNGTAATASADARAGLVRRLLDRLAAKPSESKRDTVTRRLDELKAEIAELEERERILVAKLGPLATAEQEAAVLAEALALPPKDTKATAAVQAELERVRASVVTKRAALAWLAEKVPQVEHEHAVAAIAALMPAYRDQARRFEAALEGAAEAWRGLAAVQAEMGPHLQAIDQVRDRIPSAVRADLPRPAATPEVLGLVGMYQQAFGPMLAAWKARARQLEP